MPNNKIIIIFGLGLDLLLYQVYVGSDGWDKAAAQLLRLVCVFHSDSYSLTIFYAKRLHVGKNVHLVFCDFLEVYKFNIKLKYVYIAFLCIQYHILGHVMCKHWPLGY